MGEVTGGEQPPILPISRAGAGIRASRVMAADDGDDTDIAMRADFWIKGLRTSNIYDDRQAAGRSFYAEASAFALPDDGVLEVLGKPPADLVVVAWMAAQGEGAATLEFFEDTVVSADGTPKVAFNKNRIFRSVDARFPLFTAPTITNDGNRIAEIVIPAGEKQSSSTFDSGIGDLVLLPGANYLMRLTNISGSPSTIFFALQWFEADLTELPQQTQERAGKEIEP